MKTYALRQLHTGTLAFYVLHEIELRINSNSAIRGSDAHLKSAHVQEPETGLKTFGAQKMLPDIVFLDDAEIYKTVDAAVATHQTASSMNLIREKLRQSSG